MARREIDVDLVNIKETSAERASPDVDAGRVAAFAAVVTGIVVSTSAAPSGIRRTLLEGRF